MSNATALRSGTGVACEVFLFVFLLLSVNTTLKYQLLLSNVQNTTLFMTVYDWAKQQLSIYLLLCLGVGRSECTVYMMLGGNNSQPTCLQHSLDLCSLS